jgi:hypothetical protein
MIGQDEGPQSPAIRYPSPDHTMESERGANLSPKNSRRFKGEVIEEVDESEDRIEEISK